MDSAFFLLPFYFARRMKAPLSAYCKVGSHSQECDISLHLPWQVLADTQARHVPGGRGQTCEIRVTPVDKHGGKRRSRKLGSTPCVMHSSFSRWRTTLVPANRQNKSSH